MLDGSGGRRFYGAGFEDAGNTLPISRAAAFVLACAVSVALWAAILVAIYQLMGWVAGRAL